MNLLNETRDVLKENGLYWNDISWIGCLQFKIDKEKAIDLFDVDYHQGFGGQEISNELIVVGNGWWLERHEYDGSEWWEFKKLPVEPKETKEVKTVKGDLWNKLRSTDEVDDNNG